LSAAWRGGSQEQLTQPHAGLAVVDPEGAGKGRLGGRGKRALVVADEHDPIGFGEQVDGPGQGVEAAGE